MKNVEYDIPVFESRDVSDLNLYSERMAEAIKKQIDKFGNPLVFKGIKQTRSELDSITNAQNGDMYRVRENGKNYIWDGNEWVVYSDAIVIDDFQTKIIKVIQEVETPTPVTGTKINIKDSVEAKITEFNILGNQKQETREGYNIFNPDKAFIVNTRTVGGATINKNSDGSFSISGTGELTANFGGGYTDYTHEETIALLKEGTITFDCGAKTTPCCVIELIGQSTYFSLNNSASTSLSATITSEMLADTSLKLRASFYGKTGQTIVGGTIKPMLYQQGNGTFEQFGKSPSPNYQSKVKTVGSTGYAKTIISSQNYFEAEVEQGAINSVEGNNYNSEKTSSTTRIRTKDLIKVDENKKYILKFDEKYNVVIQAFNSSKLLYSKNDGTTNIWHANSFEFSGYPYIAIAIRNKDNTSVITPAEITQVNIDLAKANIYNMPIQQEMLEEDKFDWDNEKEVHNWKKLVINGTENWSMFPNTPKLGLFMLSIDDIKSNQEEYAIEDIICTHFKAKSLNNTWLGKEGISVGNKQIRIFCSSNDTNTVEKWKAYLVAQYNAGTPVIVYYKLEVPTQLAFTTQQKEVAKQIKQAKTYDGVTNIYSECEVEPNLEIIYKKNIQTLFDNTLI